MQCPVDDKSMFYLLTLLTARRRYNRLQISITVDIVCVQHDVGTVICGEWRHPRLTIAAMVTRNRPIGIPLQEAT